VTPLFGPDGGFGVEISSVVGKKGDVAIGEYRTFPRVISS
jgi:hypothetical protein